MARGSVLIVEDHALLTQTLIVALRARDFEVVAPTDLRRDAVLAHVRARRFEVALVDLDLGEEVRGVPLIGELVDLGCHVLVVTGSTSKVALAEGLEAGARGVFLKSQPFEDLVSMVEMVIEGRPVIDPAERESLMRELRESRAADHERHKLFDQLTPREAHVLTALVHGKSAETISGEQVVSLATVRSHIRSILMKLGVRSQLSAVAMARDAGWPWA